MSFFNTLIKGLTPSLGNVLSTGINLAGNLIAGGRAQEGYDNAATIAQQTSAAQLEELKRAKAAGLGHLDTGAADYEATVAPLLAERPVLMPTYRGLTAQQQLGQQDLLRTGQAQLASSGLRGAGRAGVGTVLDSMGRYNAAARGATDAASLAAKAGARNSADAARTGLATIKANTGTAKANTELGVGSQNSAILGNSGQAQGNLATQSGNTAATMIGQTGQLVGNALQFQGGYNAGNSPNQPPVLTPQVGQQQPAERQRV
jgi:hypothetical protein